MKAKHRPAKDRISALPENIIETILCHLHIRDAVRTSVLSKDWRYIWTRIPKLVFVEDTFGKVTGSSQLSGLERHIDSRTLQKCNFRSAIYQVLLMYQGPILEFTVDMEAGYSCFELDQIIVHLSRRNTVTELKLLNGYVNGASEQYAVPFSIYSLHQLTHLHLFDCYIKHKPTFSGFGNLTSLCLKCVSIEPKTLLHLLSKSTLLKRVNLYLYYQDEDGHMPFIDLLECLHLVEHLKIGDAEWIEKCLIVEAAPQKLPTSLVHLRKVSFEICFNSNRGLSILALLIKSSPNLKRIKLRSLRYHRDQLYIETNPITLNDYSNIWLEHLYELKIEYFTNMKTELEFVKLILAKSPMLKKAKIVLDTEVTKDEEMLLSRILLIAPSVSPVVEITVERIPRY